MRPDFCHIENIPPIGLSFFGLHYLQVSSPGWVVLAFDGIEEISDIVIGIFSSNSSRFFTREVLDALVGLQVDFDVDKCAVLADVSIYGRPSC